ncbi:MAG: histidine kinase [Methyloglobulus sp.]|nr:sensor histidine kinase [Methyloglobulus sp.]
MNLKTHLLLQIILVAMTCLIATATYVLYHANQQIKLESRMTAESLSKQLESQLLRIDANIAQANHFPDFDLWKQTHMQAGICIRYISIDKENTYGLCQGENLSRSRCPKLFEKIYRRVFNTGFEVSRPISFNGREYGSITVTPNVEMELAKAWDKVVGLLGLSASTVVAVCLLVSITIYRALRPAEVIVSGLENMQNGDLTIRLPTFKLIEWQRIGAAINEFSATQNQLLAERKKLVLKLMTLQEEERCYLARELHDELGQCLAAINAFAAAIAQTAKLDCPQLVQEAESISRINQHIMDTVRSMLVRLRPTELDELGLESCLKAMIMKWNRQSSGKIHYQLNINGNCQSLKEPLPITLFRIVQEGLTNIAKHSTATDASVTLEVVKHIVVLTIADNGNLVNLPFAENQGIGLLGIRERASGLGGHLKLEVGQSGGLIVRVELPFQGYSGAQI